MHHPINRIAHTTACYTSRGELVGMRTDDPLHHEWMLYHWATSHSPHDKDQNIWLENVIFRNHNRNNYILWTNKIHPVNKITSYKHNVSCEQTKYILCSNKMLHGNKNTSCEQIKYILWWIPKYILVILSKLCNFYNVSMKFQSCALLLYFIPKRYSWFYDLEQWCFIFGFHWKSNFTPNTPTTHIVWSTQQPHN